MFKQPFNLALVRNIQQGMGFYLVFWLVAMVGSIVFSIPAIIWWGGSWQAKAEDYFKFLIIGTHAVCALFSLYLSIETAKTKGIKSKSIILLSVVFAIISGVFASPTTPILASIISTAEHGQKEITKKQIYIFLILMVFATITYFVSYSMNSR